MDTVQDDDLEESSININPVNLNGGIDAGIQSNPDSSDNIKYVTVLNYEQLLDAFDDLDTNHDSAVITLSGSSIYTVTQPIVFGTDQSITNVTINDDKTTENINQFTVEYTTRYNHNNNQILLVDCIDFNKNNNYTAMIETN
ncbi:MAG: hypothetical protein IKF79_03585, partial [Methanosphaera sp.]|nr:hypothetical protein [Methanosphaera sp.]